MKTLLRHLTAAALLTGLLVSAAFAQTPPTPTVVQFTASTYDTIESGSSLWIGIEGMVSSSVRLSVSGGTATPGTDLNFGTGGSFQDGVVRGAYGVSLVAHDDGVSETDETVELTLSDPGPNSVLGARTKATVTIRNRPPTLEFHAGLSESFGGSAGRVEVIRRGDREPPVSVDVSITGGGGATDRENATAGVDFLPLQQTVHFASGEINKNVDLSILDDGELEEDEFVTVTLSQPSPGVVVPTATQSFAIIDNEVPTHYARARITVPFALIEGWISRVHPLPEGGTLLVGESLSINGVSWEGSIVKLDANDELDDSFRAAVSSPEVRVLPLRNGKTLVGDGGMRRLNRDGSLDASFQFPSSLGDPVGRMAEAADGTLWILLSDGHQSSRLIHVSQEGVILQSIDLPGNDAFLPPGNAWSDPNSRNLEIMPLEDGRLVVRQGVQPYVHRVHFPDGSAAPSFPTLKLVRVVTQAGWSSFGLSASLNAGVSFPVNRVEAVNGLPNHHRSPFSTSGNVSLQLPLQNLPKTALLISGELYREFKPYWTYDYPFSLTPEPPALATDAFTIIFRRLGHSAGAASLHYTTRDGTAVAGKDYVAQRGALTFAPLEVEKTITIPVLADAEDESDETLEVAVTSADGFEVLPPAMMLTIEDRGGSRPAPRLNHVKRLRDGRVLLGGTGPRDTTRLEFSPDLQTWHPLTNLLGGFNGPSAVWLDASATNASTRYYRAVGR